VSCWIVAHEHIDVLVQHCIVECLETPLGTASFANATELSRLLWSENNRSFTYRYSDDGVTPEDLADVESYRFTGIEAPLDPGVLFGAWCSYQYQSCEHPEWEASGARAVSAAALAFLPEADMSAGWRIERREQAIAESRAGRS